MAANDSSAGDAGVKRWGDEGVDRRLKMINSQLRTCDVTDAAVLGAFLAVPRERFAASASANLAYLDMDIAAAGAATRKLLAPRTLGRLLQAAEIAPGDRALDVGGGSGYTAALLAALGCKVVMLESDAGGLAAARTELEGLDSVTILPGELAAGAASNGPFDVIVINGAFEEPPGALIAQLAEGGRLVGVDARSGAPRGTILETAGPRFSERALFDATADTLPGFARAPSFAF